MNRIIFSGALALALTAPAIFAQPKPKSQAELDALKAMYAAQTADARIAACENVLEKFKDSDFKATALYFEALSYEQKGDYANTVVFGERTLEADPKHYEAMLMLASDIAQHTKEFDLDREQKLAQVEKYANTALELLKDAPKPNNQLTDEQWAGAKKDFAAQAHAALAMGAMARKKYDVAESEFKTAISSTDKPDPGYIVRLGRVYSEEGKYDDAIAQYDKVMAMQEINPAFRQVAQAERVRTIQKKNAANPAAPAASGAPGTPPAAAPPAKPDAPKPNGPQQ